jgi:hypothetical protein
MKISKKTLLFEKMVFRQANAYWISSQGKIVEITSTHIAKIIANPEAFGLTEDEVRAMYDEENEKLGQEGIAREKIIKSLISKGWIRIRYYRKNGFWTININKASAKNFDLIQQWAEQIIKLGFSRYDNVNIDTPNSNIPVSPVDDIANDKLYNLLEVYKPNAKIILDHVSELSKYDKPIFIKRYDLLSESSLSKIFRYNEKFDCGAITSFRRNYSKKENRQRNRSLKAKLINKGYELIKILGKYPEGEEKDSPSVREEGFFVLDTKQSGNLEKDLITLGEEFEQDSILYVPKGTVIDVAKAYLVGTSHNPEAWLGYLEKNLFNNGATFGKDSKIYTSYVNGRPFIFEDFTHIPKPSGMIWKVIKETATKHWSEL